jgi:hypothetical protein
MPSDLQRVARGLVECLDEVPQVVAHLQRTAERCRENAALAIIASQGRATVAAQQLDAAARSCEEAAHYLSMAPPKTKAWAQRLIGDGTTTNRPDSASADRNKATGGAGDLAERDPQGRTKRLSAPFNPSKPPEAPEPPLIKIARKAFETLRKKQQQDEENRETPEPLEVEITVTSDGQLAVQEPANQPEERDFQIAVDLSEAAHELLAAMAEHGKQTWERAALTITPDHVTATFDYPQDLPQPPVVDIELPDLPALNPAEFDPAFDPGALSVDFAPGVHDRHGSFLPKELLIAKRLEEEGWRIDARLEDHTRDRHKNPDAMVRKGDDDAGVVVEFKTQDSGSSSAVKRNMLRGTGQLTSGGEVVIDGRSVSLTEESAFRAFRRACGQPGKAVAAVVHVILGDGRLVTFTKEQ